MRRDSRSPLTSCSVLGALVLVLALTPACGGGGEDGGGGFDPLGDLGGGGGPDDASGTAATPDADAIVVADEASAGEDADVAEGPDEDAGPDVVGGDPEDVGAGPCPDTCGEDYPALPACAVAVWDVAACECELVEAEDATACQPSDPCLAEGACEGGFCVASGKKTDCKDGDPCTVDSCVEGVGCAWEAVDCDDGDACTQDECVAGTGCTHAPFDGTACDDGQECTSEDTCLDGACIGALDPACPEHVCSGDPTRTLYANYYPEAGCEAFKGDQSSCELAWEGKASGALACYWKVSTNPDAAAKCLACNAGAAASGACANTCEAPPCAGDPDRIWYASAELGGCGFFSGDEAGCEAAWETDVSGNLALSCSYAAATGVCSACAPAAAAAGECASTCGGPAVMCPGDPGRYIVANETEEKKCSTFDEDPGGCALAFMLDGDEPQSCLYKEGGGGGPKCVSCDGSACANACEAPGCADDSKGLFAGIAPEAGCGTFDGDPAACASAYETRDLGNTPVACWHDGASCRACEAADQLAGSCAETCGGPYLACGADPARTVRADLTEAGGCAAFSDDEAGCSGAFSLAGQGVASCYFKTNATGATSCKACSPSAEGSGACANSCAGLECAADASKKWFTAEVGCGLFDEDPASCGVAFQKHALNHALQTCWWDPATTSCKACSATAAASGQCAASCLGSLTTCAGDVERVILATETGSGTCGTFDGDAALCAKVFDLADGEPVSCYFGGDNGTQCLPCIPEAVQAGSCSNACDAPACADETKKWYVNPCGAFDGDPAHCALAWEGGGASTTSCGYDEASGACGPCDGAVCADTCE